MEKQTIQELWALPRQMTPLPFDFHGHKLYSSEKLKLKFFEAVLATDWGKYHAKNLKRLVQREFIVPVLMNKGILSFLAKKFVSRNWTKNVQGLYSGELRKVLVFIDNNSNWLGVSSNKHLVKTTLHECMHLSASDNMKGFFRIMQPTFKQYYGNYFSDIFACKKIDVTNILKALINLEGKFSINDHRKYMDALGQATKKETSLDESQYNDMLQSVFTATRLFPMSPNLLMRYYPKFFHVFRPLNDAYIDTFNERNKYTTPAQELWALSEVAAVMVELLPTDKRVANVLSNIK